ncbi:MAG: hypothetical protein WA858_23635 [Xanthobacteraceae bacterium]
MPQAEERLPKLTRLWPSAEPCFSNYIHDESDESGDTNSQYDPISMAVWQDETPSARNDHDGQTPIGAARAPISRQLDEKVFVDKNVFARSSATPGAYEL